MGIIHGSTGEFEKAMPFFQQSLLLYKQVGDKKGEAQSIQDIGGVFFNSGKPGEALPYFEQALLLRSEIKDRDGEADTRIGLGGVYTMTGRPEKAVHEIEQALAIYRQLANKEGEASALSQVGNVYAFSGEFPKALTYYEQAQEQTFKREAGQYRYLHLATHGFTNDAAPLMSSLVLAEPSQGSGEDGFLTARELSELDLTAEMVVLSACNTGRGERKEGEGIIGLTWALFVAGCPTSVVSQWGVNDESTAQLMTTFYRHLKQGQRKAEALRNAVLQLRAQPKTMHPFYWAPFILIGNGD